MEENLKSKLGFAFFFFIVISLLIGGYIYTKYTINEKNMKKIEKEKEVIDYRIDKDKDYIYFKNEETISEEGEIHYKDVVINLNTQEVLNESLEKENKMYKESIKYIKDQELLSDEIVKYNYDGIYSLKFRDYSSSEFGKYLSLVINEYNYSCFDNVEFIRSISYVFNKEDGSLITSDDLLNMYNTNIDILKDKVKEYITSKQSVVDGVELIKIDDTVNNLEYSLFINEFGKLSISFLVKTNLVDYNEVMEVK